jgi:hypothetical protein
MNILKIFGFQNSKYGSFLKENTLYKLAKTIVLKIFVMY